MSSLPSRSRGRDAPCLPAWVTLSELFLSVLHRGPDKKQLKEEGFMWLTVGGDTVLHCDMGVGAVV